MSVRVNERPPGISGTHVQADLKQFPAILGHLRRRAQRDDTPDGHGTRHAPRMPEGEDPLPGPRGPHRPGLDGRQTRCGDGEDR